MVATAALVSLFVAATSPSRAAGSRPAPAPKLTSLGADPYVVYGPTQFKQSTTNSSTWFSFEDSFDADLMPGWRYVVEIVNGTTPVTSADVGIEYHDFVGRDQFGSSSTTFLQPIDVAQGTNTLVVDIKGVKNSYITVRVLRDRDATYKIYTPFPTYARQVFVRPGSVSDQTVTFGRPSDSYPPYTLHLLSGDSSNVNRITSGTVSVNGTQVLGSSDFGSGVAGLHRDINLHAAGTTDTLTLNNSSASGTRATIWVTAADSTAPEIVLSPPISDTTYTGTSSITVAGTMADSIPGLLYINSFTPVASPGSFSQSVSLPSDGKYTIAISDTNSAKLATSLSRTVYRDTHAPYVYLSQPRVDSTWTADTMSVIGTWSDTTNTRIIVNGDAVGYAHYGSFNVLTHLDLGSNRIYVSGVDARGQATQITRLVWRTPPACTSCDTSGRGTSLISATGVSSFRDQVKYIFEGGGGHPATQGGAGFDASKIVAGSESVLRGFVTGRDHGALAGVKVSVLEDPAMGSTTTLDDGEYDLVVNGGATYTLRFTRKGFLEAQRRVMAPVLDYAVLDTVAMVGRSTTIWNVDNAHDALLTSRFENDSNGDRRLSLFIRQGTRATLTPRTGSPTTRDQYSVRLKEFTVGSDGVASMPSTLPPSSAYTYCVDMSLAEADTMEEAQASDSLPIAITFDKPVTRYVRDFLSMPVGTVIPSGYVDRTSGTWVADEDGRVINLLSVSSGIANLDTDGDAAADSPTQYVALAIDTLERVQIGSLFKPGEHFWRTRTQHFSAHDDNYNFALDSDAPALATNGASPASGIVGDPNATCGCVIENENRVLGETVPISGTPFALHYRSNRQFGDKAMRQIRIPLYRSPLPPGLQRIRLEVTVAGRQFKYGYHSPYTDSVVTFAAWDGTDARGRRVPGSVTATVRLGYDLVPTFSIKPRGSGNGFGNASSNADRVGTGPGGERSTFRTEWITQKVSVGAPSMASAGLGGWTITPHHFYDNNGGGMVYLGDGSIRSGPGLLPIITRVAGNGSPASAGPTGGSAISTNISPSEPIIGPDGGVYFADATGTTTGVVAKLRADGTLITWAGGGGSTPSNGMSATDARLPTPFHIAAGPDGSIYIAGESDKRLLRVLPNQTIQVVAGVSSGGATLVDGMDATTPEFGRLIAVAVGASGDAYIWDANRYEVFRVTPSGRLRYFAGNFSSTTTGTTPGSELMFRSDSISVASDGGDGKLAIDARGQLYISLQAAFIWVVGTDGYAHAIPTLDHDALYVATGRDGSLYLGQSGGYNGVYRLEADGSHARVAGGFNATGATIAGNDGGYASSAILTNLTGMAPAADGKIYVAQGQNSNVNVLWAVRPPGPIQSDTVFAYPSEDGHEIWHFSKTGRHLRTIDATTGVILYSFGYDAAGQLTSVTDANNRVTQIQRDGAGKPTAIVSPDNLQTSLHLDSNGFLDQVTNARSSETYAFDPDDGGLLQSFTNPRGVGDTYTFGGSDGRLATVTDARTAAQTLTPGGGGVTRTVARESDLGRVTTYEITQMLDGLRRRLVSYPGHGSTYSDDVLLATSSSVTYLTREVGVANDSTKTYPLRDPRFGMLSQYPGTQTRKLPSGLTRTTTQSRSVSGGGVITEVFGINSHAFTTTYTPSTRTYAMTSPVGRTSSVVLDTQGRPVTVTVGSLSSIGLHYDAQGRLDILGQSGRVWSYVYDDSGRVALVRDTLGRMSNYAYDRSDRVIRQTLPGSRTVGSAYDANGNLTSLTPPGASTHSFAYSAVDLDSAYTPPTVSGISSPGTRYDYNADRQLTDVTRPDGGLIRLRYASNTGNNTGLLDSLTQARGKNAFTYDGTTGQLTSVTSPDTIDLALGYDGPVLTGQTWTRLRRVGSTDAVTVTLDAAFRPATQSINGGSTASFGYDDDGLLTTLAVNGSTETITRRSSDGLISGTSVGGSVTSAMSYNDHGELWKLSYAWPNGGSFQQVMTRDSLGRIVQITETGAWPHTYDYHYDVAGRLDSVRVNGTTVAGYGYDANGNRTAFLNPATGDTATATYDAQDRVLRYGNRAYRFTDNGELTRRAGGSTDTLRTTYDALGNLTGAHLPNGDTLTYRIDGANRRVGRIVNGSRTHTWLYESDLRVVAELDTSGTPINRYVYGTQGHVPDLVVNGGATYRLITDQLGSVRAVVKVTDGTVAQRMEYDAWGVMTFDSVGSFQGLGYAGGLTDRGTGLVRFGGRDYEPAAGRWTSKDPSGFRGETNLYAYGFNRPIDLIDDDGGSPRRPWSGRRDPGAEAPSPHRYNCKQTLELIEWAREEAGLPWAEAIYQGIDHHGGGGVFDFYANENSSTFTIDGRTLSSGQFGNYIAGYTGEKLGPIGYGGIRAGGIAYAVFKYWASGQGTWDDSDSVPDIQSGARRARTEKNVNGRAGCDCP